MLGCVLAAMGCAAPTGSFEEDGEPAEVAVASAPLTSLGRAAKPLVQPGEREGIPVCFTGEDDRDAERWIRQAIEQNWDAHSVMRFSGYRRCSTSFDWGVVLQLGPDTDAGLPQPDVPMTLHWPSDRYPECQGDSGRKRCIQAMVLHEVGHLLELQHPYLRPDAPAYCRGGDPALQGLTTMGPFDTDSVMMGANVCSTAPYAQSLSQNDIWGIQLLYGAPNARIGGSVPAWGGRFWWYDVDGDQRWNVERDVWTMFGDGAGVPVSGAWGDNQSAAYIEKIGTYHEGVWRLDYNGDGVDNAADRTFNFGAAGMVPAPGRYRGGPALLGVYWSGYFWIDWNNSGAWDAGDRAALFRTAEAGDVPIAGDLEGDGVDRVGIFNNGVFRFDVDGDMQFTSADRAHYFLPSGSGGRPLVDDFRNVGTDQIAVYKGEWLWIDWNGNGRWDASGDRAHFVGTDMSGMQGFAGRWHRHQRHALPESHYDF